MMQAQQSQVEQKEDLKDMQQQDLDQSGQQRDQIEAGKKSEEQQRAALQKILILLFTNDVDQEIVEYLQIFDGLSLENIHSQLLNYIENYKKLFQQTQAQIESQEQQNTKEQEQNILAAQIQQITSQSSQNSQQEYLNLILSLLRLFANQKRKKFQQINADLQKKNQDFPEQVKNWKNIEISLQDQINKLKTENINFKAHFETQKEEKFKEYLQTQELTVKQLEELRQKIQKQIQQSQQNFNQTIQQLKQYSLENERQLSQNQQVYEKSLADYKQNIDQLTAQRNDIQEQHSKLQVENQLLLQNNQKQQQQQKEDFQKKLSYITSENAKKLELVQQKYEEQIRVLEKSQSDSTEKLQKLLESKNQQIEFNIQEHKAALEKLENKCKVLQNSLTNQKNSADAQIAALRDDKLKLEADLNQKQQEIDQIKIESGQSQIDKENKNIQSDQEKNKTIRALENQYQHKFSEQEKQYNNEKNFYITKNQDLENKNQELNIQKNKLEANNQQLIKDNNDLKNTLSKEMGNIKIQCSNEFEKNLAEKKQKIQSLETDILNQKLQLRKEYDKALAEQINNHQILYQDWSAKSVQFQEKYNKLFDQQKSLRNSVQKYEIEKEALNKKIESLEQQINHINRENHNAFQSEKDILQSQVLYLQKQLKEKEQDSQNQIQQLEQSCKKLKEQLEKLRTNYNKKINQQIELYKQELVQQQKQQKKQEEQDKINYDNLNGKYQKTIEEFYKFKEQKNIDMGCQKTSYEDQIRQKEEQLQKTITKYEAKFEIQQQESQQLLKDALKNYNLSLEKQIKNAKNEQIIESKRQIQEEQKIFSQQLAELQNQVIKQTEEIQSKDNYIKINLQLQQNKSETELQIQESKFKQQLQQNLENFESQKIELNKKIEQLKNNISVLSITQETSIKSIKDEHQVQIELLNQENSQKQETITKLEVEKNENIALLKINLEQKYQLDLKEALQQINEKHSQELQIINQQIQKKDNEMEELKANINNLNQQILKLKNYAASQVKEMQDQHQNKINQINEQHMKEKQSLNKNIQDITEILDKLKQDYQNLQKDSEEQKIKYDFNIKKLRKGLVQIQFLYLIQNYKLQQKNIYHNIDELSKQLAQNIKHDQIDYENDTKHIEQIIQSFQKIQEKNIQNTLEVESENNYAEIAELDRQIIEIHSQNPSSDKGYQDKIEQIETNQKNLINKVQKYQQKIDIDKEFINDQDIEKLKNNCQQKIKKYEQKSQNLMTQAKFKNVQLLEQQKEHQSKLQNHKETINVINESIQSMQNLKQNNYQAILGEIKQLDVQETQIKHQMENKAQQYQNEIDKLKEQLDQEIINHLINIIFGNESNLNEKILKDLGSQFDKIQQQIESVDQQSKEQLKFIESERERLSQRVKNEIQINNAKNKTNPNQFEIKQSEIEKSFTEKLLQDINNRNPTGQINASKIQKDNSLTQSKLEQIQNDFQSPIELITKLKKAFDQKISLSKDIKDQIVLIEKKSDEILAQIQQLEENIQQELKKIQFQEFDYNLYKQGEKVINDKNQQIFDDIKNMNSQKDVLEKVLKKLQIQTEQIIQKTSAEIEKSKELYSLLETSFQKYQESDPNKNKTILYFFQIFLLQFKPEKDIEILNKTESLYNELKKNQQFQKLSNLIKDYIKEADIKKSFHEQQLKIVIIININQELLGNQVQSKVVQENLQKYYLSFTDQVNSLYQQLIQKKNELEQSYQQTADQNSARSKDKNYLAKIVSLFENLVFLERYAKEQNYKILEEIQQEINQTKSLKTELENQKQLKIQKLNEQHLNIVNDIIGQKCVQENTTTNNLLQSLQPKFEDQELLMGQILYQIAVLNAIIQSQILPKVMLDSKNHDNFAKYCIERADLQQLYQNESGIKMKALNCKLGHLVAVLGTNKNNNIRFAVSQLQNDAKTLGSLQYFSGPLIQEQPIATFYQRDNSGQTFVEITLDQTTYVTQQQRAWAQLNTDCILSKAQKYVYIMDQFGTIEKNYIRKLLTFKNTRENVKRLVLILNLSYLDCSETCQNIIVEQFQDIKQWFSTNFDINIQYDPNNEMQCLLYPQNSNEQQIPCLIKMILHEDFEYQYWAREYAVTSKQLATQLTGHDAPWDYRAQLTQYLKDNQSQYVSNVPRNGFQNPTLDDEFIQMKLTNEQVYPFINQFTISDQLEQWQLNSKQTFRTLQEINSQIKVPKVQFLYQAGECQVECRIDGRYDMLVYKYDVRLNALFITLKTIDPQNGQVLEFDQIKYDFPFAQVLGRLQNNQLRYLLSSDGSYNVQDGRIRGQLRILNNDKNLILIKLTQVEDQNDIQLQDNE